MKNLTFLFLVIPMISYSQIKFAIVCDQSTESIEIVVDGRQNQSQKTLKSNFPNRSAAQAYLNSSGSSLDCGPKTKTAKPATTAHRQAVNPRVATKASSSIAPGEVYLLRKSGYTNSLLGFKVLMDGQELCKIRNRKYSIQHIKPGIHEFYFHSEKGKDDAVELDIKSGETYYIEVQQVNKFFMSEVKCTEITKSAADRILPGLAVEKKCQ